MHSYNLHGLKCGIMCNGYYFEVVLKEGDHHTHIHIRITEIIKMCTLIFIKIF